ncbi:MAG: AAA family ATPase, partial [Candidatus Dormibacteria bacterium]
MHFYRGSGAQAAMYMTEGHLGAEVYYSEQARVDIAIDTWADGVRVASTHATQAGEFAKWVEGLDLATGELKGVMRSGGPTRQPLRFVEQVINNPKSLSIVAAVNPVVAQALDEVLGAQADELGRYYSRVAVTRVGGRANQAEVGGLVIETARVTHYTSREADPHRHIHLMLNVRAQLGDATWHSIHSAALRGHIAATNAIAHGVMMGDPGLRTALASQGLSLGPDGEVNEARDAVGALSKRAAQVGLARDVAEAAWRGAHPGREPGSRVRHGWDRSAWESSRAAKAATHESVEEMSLRIAAELGTLGYDFGPGVRVPVVFEATSVGQVDRDGVAGEALARCAAKASAWSEATLTAEVAGALTATGVVGDRAAMAECFEDVRARAKACCVSLLEQGRVPTAASVYLSSATVIEADRNLNLAQAGLVSHGGVPNTTAAANAVAAGLDAGQAQAVGAIAGTRRLEVVIGPAGAGKTAMLNAAKQALEEGGRSVVVLAPTRQAAMVAGAEVKARANSVAKAVYDHGWRWDTVGRWSRLAVGEVDPATATPYAGPPASAVLGPRSVVVVDEAGLLNVDAANALVGICAEAGAALRLVGDPRQLPAVGRGGVIETAARWVEVPVELGQVHRFLKLGTDEAGMPQTVPDTDYAALSLAMRAGEAPEAVAEALVTRGAVVAHASVAEATAAIAGRVLEAVDRPGALAVTVATNEAAAALNAAVRAGRIAAGAVDDTRVALGAEGVRIGAGDLIVTRHNDAGADVSNRQRWRVEAISDTGAIVAVDGRHRVTLAPGWAAQWVQLAYAVTDYGNQGVTTDASLTWVGGATTAAGLYVGASRGRLANEVHVVASDIESAKAAIIGAMGRDRADRGLEVARATAQA